MPPPPSPLAVAVLSALVASLAGYVVGSRRARRRRPAPPVIEEGVVGLIGNTPVVKLVTLSKLTGCTIYAKCEFMNPGGSSKDRIARAIMDAAEERGLLRPGGRVYEGTVGSTGVSLALLAAARGYQAHIYMPDDAAMDKVDMLRRLGAHVHRVRPVSIIDAKHFVHQARADAAAAGGVFADQFETEDNWRAHYATTAPELHAQVPHASALVMGAGTGGTLAGLAAYLKPRIRGLRVVVADPQGSGLYNKVRFGVLFHDREREGTRTRHQIDTLVEGVGMTRMTRNAARALPLVDDAVKVTDQEALDMARYLMRHEGLFVGSSSAVNVVAAVRVAKDLGPGHTVVTLLCDSGTRHLAKFWNDKYCIAQGLVPNDGVGADFVEAL